MTREEKCKLFIEKGFTYDKESGIIYGIKGNEITSTCGQGYKCLHIRKDNKIIRLKGHQFAWYWVNKECVEHIDHINGLRDDNRICNLRSVTKQENSFNIKKVKGYCWSKLHNKWVAQITFNYKKIHLGLFDKEEDARKAYLEAKEKYHKIK